MEEDKSPLAKIFFVLFIISTLFVGGFYLFSYRNNISFSNLIPNISGSPKIDYGYNFELPISVLASGGGKSSEIVEEVYSPKSNPKEETNVEENVKDEVLTVQQKEVAFDYQMAEGKIGTIIIPKIGINSQVLNGSSELLMDQGFWHYPSSFAPGQGEAIFLCHRRFFGQTDPRSCWKINELSVGDTIQVNDNNGKPLTYKVKTTTIISGEDLNIYQVSKENYLKIVSCSLASGVPGGSTHRYVVIAEQV